jgi:protein-disulfide isomerase
MSKARNGYNVGWTEQRGFAQLTFIASITLAACLAGPTYAGSPLVRDDGRTRGNPAAPITLIEYSDFTCGFCLKFFRETWPRLQAKYIESGLVRFVYRDFPRAFQGPGLQAAVATRCAGEQGRYWPMHDRLFASNARLGPSEFEGHASAIGLNVRTFSSCVREGRYVDAILRDREEGVTLGFRGTPGFVLVSTDAKDDTPLTIPGAFPFEVFEEHIERLLTGKRKG